MYGASNNFPKTAGSVDEWLDAIQMGSYKENFKGFAVHELRNLSNSALKELVPLDGPRKRLTLAINQLDVPVAAASSVEPQVKFNSTSSMYIDSTISKPCTDEIIFCVSIVIHDRIEEGEESVNKANAEVATLFPMFDVESKPLFRHAHVELPASSEDNIFHTIKSIYSIAEFSPECLVISLLYIERLRSLTGIPLLLSNWQPILLAAMVVAQKVWDDKSLLNVDFSVICSAYTLKDINNLEKKFLELLEYNVSITASLYASYYFELRTLCEKSERSFTLKPLSEEARKQLESRSNEMKEDLQKKRRWQSLGSNTNAPNAS